MIVVVVVGSWRGYSRVAGVPSRKMEWRELKEGGGCEKME